jgi:DNA mismatch repair protein MutL
METQQETPARARRIGFLPAEVIERIAAGEIIERPASVARELIENALDAGATSVRVELREGGLRLLRVSDDGAGIASEDLDLAYQPHATSKVHALDDLVRVQTLGFRGEALASIAAVAEVEIASAADESGLASVIALGLGNAPERTVVSRSRGTMVTVRRLFAEMPARKALLRGAATEASRVAAVVRAYALAHPTIQFTLIADGSFILRTAGNDLAQAIASVYGADVAAAMLVFGPSAIDHVTLRGAVSARGVDAPDRSHVLIAVNGRPVSNRALLVAAEAGYRPLFRKGRHPVLVVSISAPPDELDVNIHPAKAEVLLRAEQAIATTLRTSLHDVLGNAPAHVQKAEASAARGEFARAVQLRLPPVRARRGMVIGEDREAYGDDGPAHAPDAAELPMLEPLGQLGDALIVARTATGHLYLVDQHRAHERILYDRLCREADPAPMSRDESGSAGQLLLVPVLVELSPIQARLLLARLDELAGLGLEVQHFGGAVFLVRSLPSLPSGPGDPSEVAREAARAAAEDTDDWLDEVCISLACRSAIRRGQVLSATEQKALLDTLREVRVPAVCPHGSPLILTYNKRLLARAFEW